MSKPKQPAPQTLAERQRSFRERRKDRDGLVEVRHIWVRPDLVEKIKAYARRLMGKGS